MKHIFLLFALTLTAHACFAERADRDKPMQIEADKVTVDDVKKIQILEGNVVVTKGTLSIHSSRMVITEDRYGFQKGTAFSGKEGLARFRQKREGKDEYITGEAERIEYNTNNEIAEFFHRAWVQSGEDQIKGDYIWYDAINEKYLVSAGETRNPQSPPPRVRAILQPKNKTTAPPEETPNSTGQLELRGTNDLSIPPSHRE